MLWILQQATWAAIGILATQTLALPSSPAPNENGTCHIVNDMLKRDTTLSKRAGNDIVYLVRCDYTKDFGDSVCGGGICGCLKSIIMAAWYSDWRNSLKKEWPGDRTYYEENDHFEGVYQDFRWEGSGYKLNERIRTTAWTQPFFSGGVNIGYIRQWFHGDNRPADNYGCKKDNNRLLWYEASGDGFDCSVSQLYCYSQYYCAPGYPIN